MKKVAVEVFVTYAVMKYLLVEDEDELNELFDAWEKLPEEYDEYDDDIVEKVLAVEINAWNEMYE